MQIAASKKTVYTFDHPTEGFQLELIVSPYASGFMWELVRPSFGERCSVLVDSYADSPVDCPDGQFYGFSIRPVNDMDDIIGLFFGKERVFLD